MGSHFHFCREPYSPRLVLGILDVEGTSMVALGAKGWLVFSAVCSLLLRAA
jgi:hypothetical protein